MPSVSTSGTSSGITTTETGDRHIPASVRADGSTRKEIKIRPGYKPPEDVEVYKNRTAEAWKSRGTGGVPGAASVEPEGETKSSNTKNAKRREARRKAKAAEEGADGEADSNTSISKDGPPNEAVPSTKSTAHEKDKWRQDDVVKEEPQPPDLEADKEKQVRNLKKKLRQARDLSAKKDKGENLLPEQFEKVIKMNELIRQLDNLGFDMDGQPK
ncbi:hypothetical protein G7Y79_00015g039290 [Physcia stellaris]|nr:hypothetical protein G7Y79_00015g039290 [Physcia stellaris]